MDYHLYISPITRTAPYLSRCFTWKWVQWNSEYSACGSGGQPTAPVNTPGKHLPVLFCCPARPGVSIIPLPDFTEKPKPQCQFSFSSPQCRTKNILDLSLDFPSDLCYFQSYWCEMFKPFWNWRIWRLTGIINGFLFPTVLLEGELCSPAWLLLMSMAHRDGTALRKLSQELDNWMHYLVWFDDLPQ